MNTEVLFICIRRHINLGEKQITFYLNYIVDFPVNNACTLQLFIIIQHKTNVRLFAGVHSFHVDIA